MNPALATPPTATAIARPDIDRVVAGLRHRNRWKMLKELSCGEPRTIAELAKVAGCGYDNASQHLRQLYLAGLIVRGRGHVYEIQAIPAQSRPARRGLRPLPAPAG